MTPNEYQNQASRTCLKDYETFKNIQSSHRHIIHAHLGLSSETGEIGDAIKKHVIYGQPLDIANLLEECGDILWYVSLMVSACDSSLEQVMEMNIDKLRKRYPNNFTEELAAKRLDKQ